MLTVNDKETGLFEIQFPSSGTEAVLVPYAGLSPSLFEPLTPGRDLPWDVEGIGIDSTGALYLSEEHSRWILKQSAPGKPLERLPIDWSPASRWFSKTDRNASFEGVAVGDRFLYVANERDTGRILEVDRKTLRVVSDFQPRPPGASGDDIHYTDLCWFDGELWALCREHRRVLCINPHPCRAALLQLFSDRNGPQVRLPALATVRVLRRAERGCRQRLAPHRQQRVPAQIQPSGCTTAGAPMPQAGSHGTVIFSPTKRAQTLPSLTHCQNGGAVGRILPTPRTGGLCETPATKFA